MAMSKACCTACRKFVSILSTFWPGDRLYLPSESPARIYATNFPVSLPVEVILEMTDHMKWVLKRELDEMVRELVPVVDIIRRQLEAGRGGDVLQSSKIPKKLLFSAHAILLLLSSYGFMVPT